MRRDTKWLTLKIDREGDKGSVEACFGGKQVMIGDLLLLELDRLVALNGIVSHIFNTEKGTNEK